MADSEYIALALQGGYVELRYLLWRLYFLNKYDSHCSQEKGRCRLQDLVNNDEAQANYKLHEDKPALGNFRLVQA